MRNICLLLLTCISFLYAELSVRIAENNRTSFFKGETVVIAVEILGATDDFATEHNTGSSPYVLQNLSGNASWLQAQSRPEYDEALANANNHWQNNQSLWLELIGTATSAGNYSGTLQVTNTSTNESKSIPYSFSVESAPIERSLVKVAMRDAAASYRRQMEIRTQLQNISSTLQSLQNPYIDYYASRDLEKQPLINVWGKPGNTCIQILECGTSGNFVIRHRFNTNVVLQPNSSLAAFQIGYSEISSKTNSDYYDVLPEKDLLRPINALYLDYSYGELTSNQYTDRAMKRNWFYNDREVLYDHSGNSLSGTPPSWYSEQSCSVVRMSRLGKFDSNRFRTNTDILGNFCTDDMVNTAPEILMPVSNTDTIYEGEDYVFRPSVTDAEGDSVSMALVNAPDWLEIGSAADYWDDYFNVIHNNVNGNQYRSNVYVRSKNNYIRKHTTILPGSYSFTLKATDAFGASDSISRTIVVLEGSRHPAANENGVAVLIGDETWFKKYQLDVASGIVNYSNNNLTLTKGWHYDYYGTHLENIDPPPARHWYVDGNVSVSYVSCANGRFRLRYLGNNNLATSSKHTYQDSKAGFVYRTGEIMMKNDDYSISDFFANGDTLRSRSYASNAPLYNGDGTLLWGAPPTWASECLDEEPASSSSFLTSSSSSLSSSSPSSQSSSSFTSPSSSSLSSSSSLLQSSSSLSSSSSLLQSSSSKFNAFTDLSIQFKDISTASNVANMFFAVSNNGNQDADIGNFEARFYYNDVDSIWGSNIKFNTCENIPGVDTCVTERCNAGLYAFKMKFSEDAVISASQRYPSESFSMFAHLDSWHDFDWHAFASWSDFSDMQNNPKMALFDNEGRLVYGTEAWECDGYSQKILDIKVTESVYVEYGGNGSVNMELTNSGDSSITNVLYLDYYVRHPAGQVPILAMGRDTLTVANFWKTLTGNNLRVIRLSSGENHIFRFELADGIKSLDTTTFAFNLFDQCSKECTQDANQYSWNFNDDWSAVDAAQHQWTAIVTEKVVIHDLAGNILYGKVPETRPEIHYEAFGKKETSIATSKPNRTDIEDYSIGQLLSGGDFETSWLQGWNFSDSVKSTNTQSPQGSRHVVLNQGDSISQNLPIFASRMLSDSGAVLTLWHTGNIKVSIEKNGASIMDTVLSRNDLWKRDSVFWGNQNFSDSATYSLKFKALSQARLDDVILTPSLQKNAVNYTTRFTGLFNNELETRTYDGDSSLVIWTSELDGLGRDWRKYLPFELFCKGTANCNSDWISAHNPGMASKYYIFENPEYPDAQNVAYEETVWKPDQTAIIDKIGLPGAAFGILGVQGSTHLSRSFSSGVNLNGINILDSASLNSAIAASKSNRIYDSGENYHASLSDNPTHLWEMQMDPDGRKSFVVKNGDGQVVVSGYLDSLGNMLSRSVNILDARGNVLKQHSPLSCEYTNATDKCVLPSTFEYDAESRMTKSFDPDSRESRYYYDFAGRLRATQNQNQIDSGIVSVIVFDNLDRAVYRGAWKPSNANATFIRDFFANVQNAKLPLVDSLQPGTVTRFFYDKIPNRDTLGVVLYPNRLDASNAFKYSRGQLAATISDIEFNEQENNVVRISTTNSYDKYGRSVATYAYDPTMPADSLKMLAVINEYDLGGKLVKTAKYPFGAENGGAIRKIEERYTYDRLGRVDSILSKNGESSETMLAHYAYYPTGNVKSISMGNSLVLTYTYHISGAVKTANALNRNGKKLFAEELYYEDCGEMQCIPQYNGNISRMLHELAFYKGGFPTMRDAIYDYDEANRLKNVDDLIQDDYDEQFQYDAQGRMTQQQRGPHLSNTQTGGDYVYYGNTNRLEKVLGAMRIDDSLHRDMSTQQNFVYDSTGNLVEDKSKGLKISYDWRGMPTEFLMETTAKNELNPAGDSSRGSVRLRMAYDGSGRRVSKTRERKTETGDWVRESVTHYTGIGTEVRESYSEGAINETKVVANMPKGLGRYGVEDAEKPSSGNATFEWYLKNHLGSTMLVYATGVSADGSIKAAYDYRAFGEQITLSKPTEKVTENFTGKERDDETELNYFGARYQDPMIGLWMSVDAKRQHFSPYLYGSNNPVNRFDPDGLEDIYLLRGSGYQKKPEPHINYPYDEWRERLNPAIEIMRAKGYSVYVGMANGKNFAKLVSDFEAKQAFYMGHIRGNSTTGKPDALSTYDHHAVDASKFGNYSNQSVELYLFGCNSKSLENSEWDNVFPNTIGNSNEPIESSLNADQFFKSVEDYANGLPQREIE